jgi:hypothetical protein
MIVKNSAEKCEKMSFLSHRFLAKVKEDALSRQ